MRNTIDEKELSQVINVNRTERIERLVKERTVELRKINEILEQEITSRIRAEEKLQKSP